MELILEFPAEESKCSASFFLFTYSLSFFATSTADSFMVVGLGHLQLYVVYKSVVAQRNSSEI